MGRMKYVSHLLMLCAFLLLSGCSYQALESESETGQISPESVKALTKKVADWQIETFEEQGKYRALPHQPPDWMHREKYHDLEWQNGALYAGMNQWRKVSDDPKYAPEPGRTSVTF